jgi:hypothetical protein
VSIISTLNTKSINANASITSITSVTSASPKGLISTKATTTVIPSHNDLLKIQGGTKGSYYHLTKSEHQELTNWINNITLNSDGSIETTNDIWINSSFLYFGSNKDVKVYFDGNNFNIDLDNPSDIGPRIKLNDDVDILGGLEVSNDSVFKADTYWTGSGFGLPYGTMYQEDTGFGLTLATQNVWYKLNVLNTNILAGELNLVTFPDDHYLQVSKAGRYKIEYSLTGRSSASNQSFSFGIMVNDIIQSPGKSRIFFINAVRDLTMSGTTILNLEANDQISIGARNTTSAGRTITVAFINVSIIMVGG